MNLPSKGVCFPNCGCMDNKRLAPRDAKLIRYLAKHNHWTPFSQVTLKFRIQAPIFVARQWFKHQVGITRNEVSRRYVDSAPEFFVPDEWRKRPEGGLKQGSGGKHPLSDQLTNVYLSYVEHCAAYYRSLISHGVAPEQARAVLPQSMITEWIETGSLAAYARVFGLRRDSHAQAEIREYAKAIGELIPETMKTSWEALTNESAA